MTAIKHTGPIMKASKVGVTTKPYVKWPWTELKVGETIETPTNGYANRAMSVCVTAGIFNRQFRQIKKGDKNYVVRTV